MNACTQYVYTHTLRNRYARKRYMRARIKVLGVLSFLPESTTQHALIPVRNPKSKFNARINSPGLHHLKGGKGGNPVNDFKS